MNKRHELQKNELADWMEEKIEDIRPYLPGIGVGLLLAIAAVVGIWWYSNQQAHASAAAWNQYFAAVGERDQEEALEGVIKTDPQREPANWARQSLADMNLARGSAAVFTDREESKKRLERAEELYREILATSTDPMLVARAKYGLGRALEALFKPEDAKKLYEEVAQAQKGTALGDVAERAAKRLADPRDLELVKWLAEQTPKRALPTGRSGGIPGLPSDLPDRPDFGIPGIPDFGSTPLPGAGPGEGGLAFPAAGDATDTPAGDDPATDKPGDAPATDAPATDAPASDAPAPDAPAKSDAPATDAPAPEAPPASDNVPASDAPASEPASGDDSK